MTEEIPLGVNHKKVYVKSLFIVSLCFFLSIRLKLGIDVVNVGTNNDNSHISTNHFTDINVIGASYLSKNSLHLSVPMHE